MKRLFSIFSIVTALVMLFSAMGAPTPVYAATTCRGSACNGMDPNITTCAFDAQTVSSKPFSNLGILELRWSRSCNTYWTRLTAYGTYPRQPDMGAFVRVNSPYYASLHYSNAVFNQRTVWSKMLYAPGQQIMACGSMVNPHNTYIRLTTSPTGLYAFGDCG